MITDLHIEHYKSVEKLSIHFGKITVLVGVNGCGKSNIIDAIKFLTDAFSYDLFQAVSDRHGVERIRQWTHGKPYNVQICLNIDETFTDAKKREHIGRGFYKFTLGGRRGGYIVVNESGEWASSRTGFIIPITDEKRPNSLRYTLYEGGEEPITFKFSRSRNGDVKVTTFGTGIAGQKHKEKMDNLDELYLTSSAGGRMTYEGLKKINATLKNIETYSIFPNVLRQPQKPSNDIRLSSNGDNLTSVFRSLTRSKSKDSVRAKRQIINSLKSIMPNLSNISITSRGGFMFPAFIVKEKDGKTHEFNASQVSDGTLRVFGLLTALYHPQRPSLLIIEEPEQMINPGGLAVLAESIKEVGEKTQIIITTHSPDFLDHFEPEQIRAVEMTNGITNASPLRSDQISLIKEHLFSLGEIMSSQGFYINE